MNVLSKLLDRAASAKHIGYHPKCKNLGLTHLSFADDIMVLTDGRVRFVEGIVDFFEKFAKISGLKISMEKSTIYLAGVSENARDEIEDRFHFDSGQLPIRYLGLPLLSKQITVNDYMPLIEKIRNRISSWTVRFLSLAGRLQLISSVLHIISNFWLSAFRLPRDCIREIGKICSAFLWPGPELNPSKAKISWEEVCKPKQEGGLGLRLLIEVNKVCCLKLIWRIVSSHPSLLVKWIHIYLIRKSSFWAIRENTSMGSWMWRKLLKYRSLARTFHKVEIRNGKSTSFWYDNWSDLGCLFDITGQKGFIDLGISDNSTMEVVMTRRRKHRSDILNQIEDVVSLQQSRSRYEIDDVPLWKSKVDTYKLQFHSRSTWLLLRDSSPAVEWYKGVWFSYSTPKYSMLTWLSIHNRLATGDRMQTWNAGTNPACILCQNHLETRNHLFFSCRFSAEIWTQLAKKLLNHRFTTDWHLLLQFISDTSLNHIPMFLLRYVFQASIHTLWRERNGRCPGEAATPSGKLIKFIDKEVRNRLTSIREMGEMKFEEALQLYFSAQS